jgi:hypothetical protein
LIASLPTFLAGGRCGLRAGASGPSGRTFRWKKASTSGLGSLGAAILSSARRRFNCFWFLAMAMVGNGGRLGGAAAGSFALRRACLPSPSGFGV